MARKPMQDIVPKGERRSIRSVPLREDRADSRAAKITRKKEITQEEIREKQRDLEELAQKRRADEAKEREIEEEIVQDKEKESEEKEALRIAREEFEASRVKKSRRAKTRNKTIFYGVSAIVGVFVLAGLITVIFRGATITVTPKTLAFSAGDDFTAKKNPATGELPFVLVSATSSESETVHANGQKQVDIRATGVIVIYNNYSSAPQRLIKNTRFATPEGLIYRISDSVTVPGKKGTTPGSIETTVIADESGASYNVGLKDFTIPGFKGDPRYAGFYARSKTALAGGFSGIQKIVADADRAKAKSDIESKLAAELVKNVQAQTSSDQVFYGKAYTIAYVAMPDAASGDQVTIQEQGTISAAVFDQKQLSVALAKTYIKDYKGDPIAVPNVANLAFMPGNFNPATSTSLTFHLAGPASFEWTYDEVALKNALKGQPRGNVPAVLQKFPMIQKVDIAIRPFWLSSFPGSIDRIVVKKAI